MICYNKKYLYEGERKMKKNEKTIIGVLVAITIVVIIVALTRNKDNKQEIAETKTEEQTTIAQEEFVNILEDGTRLNTSAKLQETKQIEGLEISDLQLTEKENVTLLLGTITNTSDTTQGGYPIEIKVLDKNGNEITTVSAYIGTLEPGKTTQLNTSKTFDYANAYDINIAKK